MGWKYGQSQALPANIPHATHLQKQRVLAYALNWLDEERWQLLGVDERDRL